MFERFTERARQVIVLSQEESRRLKHSYIGTEHLLLGLLREEEGIASLALRAFGVSVEGVRLMIKPDDSELSGRIPFTPRAQKAIDLSLREALALGHNYIGTEHILLGLIRSEEGIWIKLLKDGYGLDIQALQGEILALLAKKGKKDVKLSVKKDGHTLILSDTEALYLLTVLGTMELGNDTARSIYIKLWSA